MPQFAEAHAKLEALEAEAVTKRKPEDKKPEQEEEEKKPEVDHLKTVAGVPDFWWKAIKNNQMIYEIVKEKDEAILAHLRHIETERAERVESDPNSRKNLTVKFHFNDNEFFTEKTLTLKVVYRVDTDDEVERIEGTPISWADESKDPTKKKIKKKQKHKKTNETRTIVKTVEAESFFNVFTNRAAPDESADLEEEEENELRDKIDQAMNLAEDIHDVLIPDALEYYLGLNEDIFDQDDMGDDDDDDDSDGSDKDTKDEGKKKGGDKKAAGDGGE